MEFDNKTNGFYFWVNQIRQNLLNNKYPSNEELYLNLIKAEEVWRKFFLTLKEGRDLYSVFIDFILYEKKNILDARPFFRIRQSDFLNKVNPFIKRKDPYGLMNLRINFSFIAWALVRFPEIPEKKELTFLCEKIVKLRNDFLIKNSPLLINRIKRIYKAYYHSFHDIQDLIGVSSNAALIALDKFVPTIDPNTGEEKYTSVILSSIIGRMNAAAFQENCTQNTKIHLYPKDRKMISFIRKMKKAGYSDKEISEIANISESELERLKNSCNTICINEKDDIEKYGIEPPEFLFEKQQLTDKIKKSIKDLSIIEKKILYLKGFF